MTRTINAPGIEINEKDRSQYDQKTDSSIVGTSTFLMGVADKGDDYSTKWINNMNTFVNNYGYPKSEAERYFYNGAYEVLNRGGVLFTSKLPYDNEVLNKYSYTSYTVGHELNVLSSPYDVLTNINGIIQKEDSSLVNLYTFLLMPNISGEYEPNVSYEQNQGIVSFEENNDDLLLYEEIRKYDFIKYFNDCEINLSIINDLMNYLSQKCNFQYYTQAAYKEIFYNGEDNEYCRNDAVYMLSTLNYNKEEFKRLYDSEGKYTEEIDSMYESLHEIGDFNGQIEKFGKSFSLKYARDYFYSLSSIVASEKGKKGGTEEQALMLTVLEGYNDTVLLNTKFTGIKKLDERISSYLTITSNTQRNNNSGYITAEQIDSFKTGTPTIGENQIYIVDMTRQKYSYDKVADKYREYIGTTAVITTPANALYYQNLIDNNSESPVDYNAIKYVNNIYSNNRYSYLDKNGERITVSVDVMLDELNNDTDSKIITGFTQNLGSEKHISDNLITLSQTAASYFPSFTYNNEILDTENMKKIGVVVFKMYVDSSADGRIGFMPVESFVGSLNKRAKNQKTGQTTFIDTIVNSNSRYINFFSNVQFSYNETIKEKPTDIASTFIASNQTITSLGFYEKDCDKIISIEETFKKALPIIMENNKDTTTIDFDIILDGGITNIAQFIKSVYPITQKGYYDFTNEKSYYYKLESQKDVQQWFSIANMIDNYCKNVRKDCIFIVDGPRQLCVNGQNEKTVRGNKPEHSIENAVLKKIKYFSGMLNSSYTAGYCDWFYSTDHYTGEYFWCPPSLKVVGNYLYTDTYSKYWNAPAGMNRGVITNDVIDVAFSPTVGEAGTIYEANWNYAVSYPMQGIITEGQKTMQKNKTAFDRVNVRRLFLGMEKRIGRIAKYFRYENITPYMMSQFKEQIESYLTTVLQGGGISEFKVVCDERNNTIQTKENNELHCLIVAKPIKSLEFIVLNFIATSQGANLTEIANEEL